MTRYGLAFAILTAYQCSAFQIHQGASSSFKNIRLSGNAAGTSSTFLNKQVYEKNIHYNSQLWSTTSEAPSITSTEETYDDLGGCTVGDTRGACLLLEEISISRGVNQIIDNIDWRVERGERWGIVGPNGAGKVCVLELFRVFEIGLSRNMIFNFCICFLLRTEYTSGSNHWDNRYGARVCSTSCSQNTR